jgi:hypothetical protein
VNIAITIREIANAGRWEATLNGGEVLTRSTQPFFDSARILIQRGCDPQTRLIMMRAGRDQVDLTTPLGAAAKLTVDKANVRFATWRPFDPEQKGQIWSAGSSKKRNSAPPVSEQGSGK